MSGRIRSIKPEILDDEKTASLSDRAWRLFVSGWVMADDHGCFRANAGYVRGKIWWAHENATNDEIETALLDLARVGLLELYVAREQRYGCVTGWSKHQRVDNRGSRRVPAPEEGTPYKANDSAPIDHSAESREISPKESGSCGSEHRTKEEEEDHDRSSSAGANDQIDQPVKAARSADAVASVLAHWVRVLYPKANPPPKLTEARRRRVKARLNDGFTSEQLCQAIDGATADDWLMGRDPKSRRGGYRDVETVLRDAAQVERLMGLAPTVATPEREAANLSLSDQIPAEARRANLEALSSLLEGIS